MAFKNNEEQRIYKREWYKRNKTKVIAEVVARKQRRAKEFLEFKKTLKCSKCPENDYRCLDFHHTIPAEKDRAVSTLVGWSMERVMSEVAKCVVLCANCHRKEHAPLV